MTTAVAAGGRHLAHLDRTTFDRLAALSKVPYTEVEPTVFKAAVRDPQGFFGEPLIETMMGNPWLVERFGLFRDTKQVPPPGMDHAEVSKRLQSPYTTQFVAGERRKGDVSVIYRAVQRTSGPVHDLCAALAATGWPTAIASGFETPPTGQALATHWDVTPVFAFQTAGVKRWQIWGPVANGDNFDHWNDRKGGTVYTDDEQAALLPERVVVDVVLEPGDVLFLPAGWPHAPIAVGGLSLHASISPLTREVYDGCGGDENHKLDPL